LNGQTAVIVKDYAAASFSGASGSRHMTNPKSMGFRNQTKRIWASQPHRPAKGRRKPVSAISIAAFVLVVAAVLWILSHLN